MVRFIWRFRLIIKMNLAFFMLFNLTSCTDVKETTYNSGIIISILTDKARYGLNEQVKISIEYKGELLEKKSNSLRIEITHLEKLVYEETLLIQENTSWLEFVWHPPLVDYSGYLVNVYLIVNDKVIDQRNIAVDVSSTWEVFPRYGYLANFDLESKEEIEVIISKLNRYHLNGLLFYDWQYKHDRPISQTQGVLDDSWLNIANKKVYASKILAYIVELHKLNMKASNYNLAYGVYEDYLKDNVEIALYRDSIQILKDKHDLPNTWASDLYLVNPLNKTWQNHFIQMEKEVNDFFAFDVIHLDTLGNRGTLFDTFGKPINMEYALAEFTKKLKSELNQSIVFNTVNEYAKYEIFKSNSVDFAYTEVWPDKYPTYASLKDIIDKDRKNGLASVLACYMNYNMKSGNFNTSAVLYTEAVILASGGAHISHGDLGMLSSEYFPNNKLSMTEELADKMIEYGDFMVAYENLLRGNLKENNHGLSLEQFEHNTLPVAKSIWLFSKENEKYKTIHLINLLNRNISVWRDDNDISIPPTSLKNVKIKMPLDTVTIEGVYVASPDIDGGSSKKLDYEIDDNVISIIVPKLDYWTMVYIVK